RSKRDWSSDVCSSDLAGMDFVGINSLGGGYAVEHGPGQYIDGAQIDGDLVNAVLGGQANTQKLCTQSAGSCIGVISHNAAFQDDAGRHKVGNAITAIAVVIQRTQHPTLRQQGLEPFPFYRLIPARIPQRLDQQRGRSLCDRRGKRAGGLRLVLAGFVPESVHGRRKAVFWWMKVV